jgi:5-methylcytosine-specific restriction endonuclease McrA
LRHWTDQEIEYLIENRLLGATELSKKLDRSKSSVIGKAQKLRIYLHESREPKKPVKSNLRIDTPRKICECGRPAASRGYDFRGYKRWSNKCDSCRHYGYRQFKKDYCETCGFVAVHSSQLDVDHIDGNNSNNEESNLQTLCANCHRLKTHLNKDYMPRVHPDAPIVIHRSYPQGTN